MKGVTSRNGRNRTPSVPWRSRPTKLHLAMARTREATAVIAADKERFEVAQSKHQEASFAPQQAVLPEEAGAQQAVSLAEALSL